MSEIHAHIGATGIVFIGAKNEAARAATIPALYEQIRYLLPDMYAAGFPQGKLVTTYAIAQMMLESDWMTSNLANSDNNYSGIYYLNKPYQNATRGIARPKGEGGGNYAHFASFQDWAKDFLRILSLNTGGKGRPIDATSAQQYLDRLTANHYFTDPHYYTKFNAALKKVAAALLYGQGQDKQFTQAYNSGQDTFTVTPGKGITSNEAFNADRELTTFGNWWTDQKWYVKGGVILTGIVAIKTILK